MSKDNIYSLYQKQIKDKDTAVSSIIASTLVKTQSMFVYTGLPDTIPETALERILQTNGNCFVTEIDGSLYALMGNAGGELDRTTDQKFTPCLITHLNLIVITTYSKTGFIGKMIPTAAAYCL